MPDPIPPPVPEGAPTLPIEETPEIIVDQPAVQETPPPAPKPQTSAWSTLGVLVLFIGLFGLGVWLSSYIRQYFPNGLIGVTPQQQEVVNAPTPTPTPVDPFATWKTYQIIGSTTKLPIDGMSYKLPADVTAPACDTTTCMSQGTYLPGGTRFTVAPRGAGQLLADFRGSDISDVGGVVFTTLNTTVNNHNAQVFTGSFSGKTAGGYGFTQMRGYMIEVTPTLSLEMNHFTPIGITADFTKDDALFEQIVSTLVMPSVATPTSVLITSPEITPATTSGLSPARTY